MTFPEEWRDVVGSEDSHQVSNLGRVRNKERQFFKPKAGKWWTVKSKVLSPKPNHDGYLRVRLPIGAKMVHVLVLEAFVGPRPEGMYGCHGNGDPADNRLTNLRWDTPKGNVADRVGHGTYQYGASNPSAKHSTQAIEAIKADAGTYAEIARRHGVSEGHVWQIRNGNARVHG